MNTQDKSKLTEWDELPQEVLACMEWLGCFGPTVHAANRELKGYMIDSDGDGGKVYCSSDDLRKLSSACIQVADWLDSRAAAEAAKAIP